MTPLAPPPWRGPTSAQERKSFVAQMESSHRRIDVVGLFDLAKALGLDPYSF